MMKYSCRVSWRKGSLLNLPKFITASLLTLPIAFGQTALTTAQIAKRASPSVVVIQGKTDSGDILGSGFIVSKDGKIVTNAHVIRDLKTASVQLASGQFFDSVSVLATDEPRDLAIIQVVAQDLPVLEMGNANTLSVGDPVVVVGSPRGLEGTVTAGILSSIRSIGEGLKVLQTDAAVNPGNSGGPLLNSSAQVVGVVSFILRSAQGLNFAVPINYVRDLMNNVHAPIKLGQMPPKVNTSPAAASIKPAPIKPPPQTKSDEPSLAKTFQWLHDNVPLLSAVRYVTTIAGDSVEISVQTEFFGDITNGKCRLSIDQEEYRRSRRDHPTADALHIENAFSVPLSGVSLGTDIQPVRYGDSDVDGYQISFESKTNIISHELPFQVGNNSTWRGWEPTNRALLILNDDSSAVRVYSALAHALDLCSRVKEPF
jgi:S1-C subfamily serine protease